MSIYLCGINYDGIYNITIRYYRQTIFCFYVYRGVQSRRIRKEYLRLVERGGSEFRILMDLLEEELRSFMDDRLVDGILQFRRGLIQIKPGYDGVYGQVKIFKNVSPSQPFLSTQSFPKRCIKNRAKMNKSQ